MAVRRLAVLACMALGAMAVAEEPAVLSAADAETNTDAKSPVTPDLQAPLIKAQTSFPDTAADLLGLSLVNSRKTRALITLENASPDPYTVRLLGGSLWSAAATAETIAAQDAPPLHNLTTQVVMRQLKAGEKKEFEYGFAQELRPQQVRLLLAAVVADKQGRSFHVEAFNGTASVVEAPISWLDPQIWFVYLFIGAVLAFSGFFVWNTYLVPLLPAQYQPVKRRSGKRNAPLAQATIPSPGGHESAAAAGATTGTGVDNSWINVEKLQRPEAKRIRSSASGRRK